MIAAVGALLDEAHSLFHSPSPSPSPVRCPSNYRDIISRLQSSISSHLTSSFAHPFRPSRVSLLPVATGQPDDGRAKPFLPFLHHSRPTASSIFHQPTIMSFHPQTPQSPSHSSNTSDLTTSQPGSVATGTTTTLPTPAHSVNGGSLLSEMAQDIIMGGDSFHKRKRDVSDIGGRAQKKVHIENRTLGITDLHLDVGEKYLLCRTRKAPFYPLTTPKRAAVLLHRICALCCS